ncbi:MAG: right-handed parallel beta-helix repeat-containing protein [Ferruginibacter sp.]
MAPAFTPGTIMHHTLSIKTGRILNNVVYNGIGTTEGVSSKTPDADGIYMDDNTSFVEIKGNTVYNVAGAGLYIHNNYNIDVQGNTFYNNGREQVNFNHNLAQINGQPSPYTTPIRNITFKNNILVSRSASQVVMIISTIRNDLDSMFTVSDSNVYARPISGTAAQIFTLKSASTSSLKYSLASYKSLFPGRDAASKGPPKSITNTSEMRFDLNVSGSPVTVSYGRNFLPVELVQSPVSSKNLADKKSAVAIVSSAAAKATFLSTNIYKKL